MIKINHNKNKVIKKTLLIIKMKWNLWILNKMMIKIKTRIQKNKINNKN